MRARGSLASVLVVIFSRGLLLVGNFATGMLTAKTLGPSGRGALAALIMWPQFLIFMSLLGLQASQIYYYKLEPERRSEYLGQALAIGAVSGCLMMIIGWIVVPYSLSAYDAHTISTARLLMLVVPVGALTILIANAIEARGRFGPPSRALVLQSVLTLLALVSLLSVGKLTPRTAAACYVLPAVPSFFLLSVDLLRSVRIRIVMSRQYARRLLGYGLRFYVGDILLLTAQYLDQFVIAVLLAQAELGLYAVALSLSRVVTVLQTSVAVVLFPSVAALGEAVVLERVMLATRATVALNVLATLGIGALAPYLLAAFYGPDFAPATLALRLLLIETILSGAARLMAQSLSSTGRPGAIALIEAAGIGTAFLVMLTLIPFFGLAGAAAAMLLASAVRLVGTIVSMRIHLGIGMPSFLLSRGDIVRLVNS